MSHPHSASPFHDVLPVPPVPAHRGLFWSHETLWHRARINSSGHRRAGQSHRTIKGKMGFTVVKNHMPLSSPAITFHHWEHYDTGPQFFGSWNQLTHNSLGSFHCCLHAVVPHCILCLLILHGAWIVRHDVQHVVAVSIRQHKVFPPQGNGNPSSVLNHSITTDNISPCKPLSVVRLKPATVIFEMLMLPKQHLTSLWSFKMRSRKLHLLVSVEMQTPSEQDRGSLKVNYVILVYRKQLESQFSNATIKGLI